MTEYRIYKSNVLQALKNLSSYDFQRIAWFENDQGLMYSFNENVSDLFDDFHLEEALYEDGVIVFSSRADHALRDLNEAVEKINGRDYREEVLIALPEMQIVRQKAAYALALIQASDGKESTVEIIE
ncbi:MAG: hypothetical protein ACK52W_04100 [Alphaproteobacteria bacterium]|jgi:hypothetical protein